MAGLTVWAVVNASPGSGLVGICSEPGAAQQAVEETGDASRRAEEWAVGAGAGYLGDRGHLRRTYTVADGWVDAPPA